MPTSGWRSSWTGSTTAGRRTCGGFSGAPRRRSAPPVGRWLSKYVLFPFGGAFLTVEFAKYLAYEVGKLYGYISSLLPRPEGEEPVLEALVGGTADAVPTPDEAAHHGVALTPESVAVTVALGVLFLALLYWPAFRSAVLAGLSAAWTGLRFVVVGLPVAVWRSPPVRALRDNAVTRFVNRYFGTGLVVGLVTALGVGPARRTAPVRSPPGPGSCSG